MMLWGEGGEEKREGAACNSTFCGYLKINTPRQFGGEGALVPS